MFVQVKVRATALDLLHRMCDVSFIGLPPIVSALLSPDILAARRDNVPHMIATLSLLTALAKTHGTHCGSVGEGVPLMESLQVAVIALQHRDKAARRGGLKVLCFLDTHSGVSVCVAEWLCACVCVWVSVSPDVPVWHIVCVRPW